MGATSRRHPLPSEGDLSRSTDNDDEYRLGETTVLVLTVVLVAPFAVVYALPAVLGSIGFDSNPFNPFGGPWGPSGFIGYIVFMAVALGGGAVHWFLSSINKYLAVMIFALAFLGVVGFFSASHGSEPQPQSRWTTSASSSMTASRKPTSRRSPRSRRGT